MAFNRYHNSSSWRFTCEGITYMVDKPPTRKYELQMQEYTTGFRYKQKAPGGNQKAVTFQTTASIYYQADLVNRVHDACKSGQLTESIVTVHNCDWEGKELFVDTYFGAVPHGCSFSKLDAAGGKPWTCTIDWMATHVRKERGSGQVMPAPPQHEKARMPMDNSFRVDGIPGQRDIIGVTLPSLKITLKENYTGALNRPVALIPTGQVEVGDADIEYAQSDDVVQALTEVEMTEFVTQQPVPRAAGITILDPSGQQELCQFDIMQGFMTSVEGSSLDANGDVGKPKAKMGVQDFRIARVQM